MKIKYNIHYYIALILSVMTIVLIEQHSLETILGKSLTEVNEITSTSEITIEPQSSSEDGNSLANTTDDQQMSNEVITTNSQNMRAVKWDLATYKPLTDAPFFKDATTVTEPLDSKYTFNLARSKDTEIIGAAIHPTQGSGQYVQIDAMTPGDVFYVTNVGYYEGESIDLEVTVNSFYKNPISPGLTLNIMFTKEFFTGVNFLGSGAIQTSGNYLDLTYTTVKSGTTEAIATNGVLPYNNISTSGMFSLSSNTIEHVYGATNSAVKYGLNEDFEGINFGSLLPTGTIPGTKPPEKYPGPFDPVRQVTTVYKELTTRRFRYESKDGRGGFTMDSRSALPINLPQPDVRGNVYQEDKNMHYKVRQYIPLEPKTHLFPDFFIDLPMAGVLHLVDLDEIKVTGNDGYQLSGNEFTVHANNSTEGQRLSVEILPTYREKNGGNDFYGNDVTVTVPVALDYTKDLSEYETDDRKIIRVPLKATTRIDDGFYQSTTSKEGLAEATNEGRMTLNHLDEQGRKILKEVTFSDVMGSKWSEPYVENGGYQFTELLSDGETVTSAVINSVDQQVSVMFTDKRYDLEVTASTPDDPTGATAKEEATMAYNVQVTSNVTQSYLTPKDNYYQTVKISLNDYPTELLAQPRKGHVQLKDGTVVGVATYDEQDNSYNAELTAHDISWQEDVVLAFEATVKKGVVPGSQIKMKPTVELSFDKGGLSYTGEGKSFSTEIVKAQLSLLSHPSSVDYGEIKRRTYGGEVIYPIKKMATNLVVKDERAAGNSWKVSAMVTKELTTTISGVNYTLPNSLKFKQGDTIKEMPLNQKVPIASQTSNEEEITNISQDWLTNKEGLVLQLNSSQAKSSEYSATVVWSLEDTY